MTGSNTMIRAFSADHVVSLTGLSKRQLRYWDDTGFFQPRYAPENRRNPHSRIYSFRDVVGLRTLAVLRQIHNVPLQHLRQVAEKLSQTSEDLWSEVTLYVLNKQVYFDEPETGKIRGVVSGQYVTIALSKVAHDVSSEVAELRKRKEDQIGDIQRKRYVFHNAWVVAGTRIPIKAIRRYHDAGFSTEQIMKEYPSLTKQDVEAALEHEERLAKSA